MTHQSRPTPPTRQPLHSLHGLPPEPLSQAARSSRAAMRAELDAAVRARQTDGYMTNQITGEPEPQRDEYTVRLKNTSFLLYHQQ